MNTRKKMDSFHIPKFSSMNTTGILKNICSADLAIQSEVISINFHCRKCGKFKNKNTKSVYCFKCLGV